MNAVLSEALRVASRFVRARLTPLLRGQNKGAVIPGAIMMRGNATTDLGRIELPQPPKRAAALKDVLAANIESAKK